MTDLLSYLFYPNPGRLTYGSPGAMGLFAVTGALILLSIGIRMWRTRQTSALTKKLSRSWSGIAMTFGIVGLVLLVARVEKIQFLAMRFGWVLWAALLLLTVFLQFRVFRMRHYDVLPRAAAPQNPRAKYLPGKKK